MLRIFITIIIYTLGFVGLAQTSQNSDKDTDELNLYTVDVFIYNINTDTGTVYFAIYDSESNFNTRNPLKTANTEIKDGVAKITFTDLEPNNYAISCFHDVNNNGKLDFKISGIPLEDYGITNNIRRMGPPRFGDAKFDLRDKDLTFEIEF